MKHMHVLQQIRTHKNIRTRHSIRTSTGPGRAAWPRLKETEQLYLESALSLSRKTLFGGKA